MTSQLKQKRIDDGRLKYNADSIIKIDESSAFEIPLTEVPSGFNSNDKMKTNNAIRHWSMSVKAPRAYIVSQEQRVEVPAIFSQKYIKLQPFICFYKTLAGACGETLSLLEDLKKDHKATLRSEDISRLSFSHTIDLVIIRLVEGSHENIAAGRVQLA
ncbi:hypothetical protein J3Q64DRAFT_1811302 [Phycomyces blakesleeanus]|uniref:Uncharacterized protein n=1 Tax=Phycomyces blakesleeanus TaxID=4837 RepID=A0ABR3APS6_PHYBL